MPDIENTVDEYYRKVYKLCLFYLQDPEEAEDLTQEVFFKVLKKKSTFKEQSSLYTWIYRIAVNTVLNYIKRKKILQFISFDRAPENAGDGDNCDSQDPAERLEQEEQRRLQVEKLGKCIRKLSDREKTAFYLFHYEGMKQKEIAGIMGASVPAVESLVFKARKKIEKILPTL